MFVLQNEREKMAQVRQNRTAERLFSYGFEVRTQHQLGSVLHDTQFSEMTDKVLFCQSGLDWC